MRTLSEPSLGDVWGFGAFRLDRANHRLWRDEVLVPLRPKAFAVLSYLVEQAGRLVDKNELLDAVWGHRHVSESALEGCICELRKALGDDARTPRYLETLARRGYRFVAEVRNPAPGPEVTPWLPGFPTSADLAHRVGREALLARLQEGWRAAQGGRRQLVFLSSEAGLGKTTLIDMFLQRLAGERSAVWWGQCIDHVGAGEAFLPLLGALQQHGVRLVPVLRAHAPAWLVQLPGLLTPEQRLELQPEVLGATRERMLREGCELLETLSAEAPLLLVLEDLHWSDGATLDLLAWLGRRHGPAKLMVLGSYRPSDVAWCDHPLQQVRQELQSHRLCVELPPERFTPDEVDAYLAARFPESRFPEDIAHILYRRSGGHPLFLVNLLDYLLGEGRLKQAGGWWSVAGGVDDLNRGVPDDLRLMIERQIARLGPDEQCLLEALSAVGPEGSAALLATVLGQDPLEVEARCETLARRGPLLAAAGATEWPDGTVAGNYAFRHALYGEVLYDRLSPAHRIALHRRLGARLEAAYLDQTGEIAAELARHFEQGRAWPQAVQYLRLASQQSAVRFANREAVDYLSRALALVERLPRDSRVDSHLALLQERALAYRALADWPGMIADLEALVALASAEGRRANEVAGLLLISQAGFHADRVQGIAYADLAIERSRDLAENWLRVYAEALRAVHRNQVEFWREEDKALISRGVQLAREAGEITFLSLVRLGQAAHYLDQVDYNGVLTITAEIERLSLMMGDGYQHVGAQYFSTLALIYLGRWGEARQLLFEGQRVAAQNSSPLGMSALHLAEAALRLEASDFPGTLTHCGQARAHPSDPFAFPLSLVLRGRAYLGLARYGEAMNWFDELTTMLAAGALVALRDRLMLCRGLGECQLARWNFAQARTEANRLLEFATPPNDRANLAHGHRLLAQIALAEQDWTEAEIQVAHALAAVDGAEVPLAAWRVYETAADVYGRLGRPDEARDFRHRTLDILSRLAGSLDEADPLRQSIHSHPFFQGHASITRKNGKS